MAELIDLPFELCTSVGRRKHELNRIIEMAPMCTISIVFARRRQCTRRHFAVICAKTAEPIDLPFLVADSGRPKKALVQSHSPDGANVPRWEGTFVSPSEYD